MSRPRLWTVLSAAAVTATVLGFTAVANAGTSQTTGTAIAALSPAAAGRLHPHLERRLQRRRQHRRQHRHLEVRHRAGQQLRHRRDRDDDQQHRQRLPGRQRPPGPAGAALGHRPDAPAGPPAGSRRRPRRSARRPAAWCGWSRSIQQPNVTTANGAGYWPAFWMLGSPLRTGTPWPTSRRGRHPRGHQRPQLGLRHPALRHQPRRPVQRVDRHRQRRAGLRRLPDRLPHLRGARSTVRCRRSRSAGTSTAPTTSPSPPTAVDATTWANAVDHPFFIIYDLAMGGGFPGAFGGGPNAATVSGGQMNIDYVAVYNKGPGGGTTPPARTSPRASRPPPPRPRTPATRPPTRPTATPAPAGPARSATRSGCRSTSASRTPSTTSTLNWEAAYGRAYQIQTSADGTTWTTIYSTTTGDGGTDDLAVTGTGRYIRVNGTAAGHRRTATRCGSSRSTAPRPAAAAARPCSRRATRPPRRRPRTPASAAANAVDGNTGTRWSSAFSDPQWLQVDLGATHTVSRVVLNWEAAYARAFQIQTSTDGNTWTNVYSTTTGDGRRPGPDRLRHRPVRADERHAARDPVRLLALGVPGLRHLTDLGDLPLLPSGDRSPS